MSGERDRIVLGGGRMRPSPRLVAVAKHIPLLILVCVGGICVIATGIVHVASGQPGEGWLRIAFGVFSLSDFCSSSGVPFATSVETCPHVRSGKLTGLTRPCWSAVQKSTSARMRRRRDRFMRATATRASCTFPKCDRSHPFMYGARSDVPRRS
jgi:hypothetical protein